MASPASSDRCTIYVSSCDKYADLWPGFFELFKKYWPDNPYPILLGSEQQTFETEGLDIKCPRFFKEKSGNMPHIPWGLLTIAMLDQIKTKYVLFMLDDFFISREVDQPMVEQCLNWMDADPLAGRFMLYPVWADLGLDCRYEPFANNNKTGKYNVITQAAAWRKDLLRSLIYPLDDPWYWESVASYRCQEFPDELYFLDRHRSDYAAIDYPYGGCLNKGYLTSNGETVLKDNDLMSTIAAFRIPPNRRPMPNKVRKYVSRF